MTLITIYVIHATVMGIVNQIIAARNRVTGTMRRYYSVLMLMKKKEQMEAIATNNKETS